MNLAQELFGRQRCRRVSTVFLVAVVGLAISGCTGGSSGVSLGGGPASEARAALISISVTPSGIILPKGLTKQFSAEGHLSDGTSMDLTTSASWTSTNPASATINTGGLVSAVAQGSTTIKAEASGVRGSADLTVGPAVLASLVVTPSNPSIAKGKSQQFTATGTLTDGSTQDLTNSVTWTSSNDGVATVTRSGIATSTGIGTTSIKAVLGSVNASTMLAVGPAILISISVVPSSPSMFPGGTQQLTATGTYSDGTSQDLTDTVAWSSSNTNVATVNPTGLMSGVATGMTTISAQFGSVIVSTIVSVNNLPTGIGWHGLTPETSLQGSSACPPNGFAGDPFQFMQFCQNVIRAWSGAIADTSANRFIIWGGGHNNYYGNEIYSLNLLANPITLMRLKDPTIPTNFSNSQNCIDGIPPGSPDFSPNSRESYEGVVFIPTVNRMMILNGSVACMLGQGSNNTWTISLNNLSNFSAWVHEDPTLTGVKPGSFGAASYGNITAYDPSSGLVFVSDNTAIYTYNYQTNTYASITATQGFVTDIYLSGGIDPTRKLFVMVGGCASGTCSSGRGVFVADISNPTVTTQQNWTAATLGDPICSEFLSGGVNPINSANPGFVFDSVANDFVGWPNQGNSVYLMTPDPVNHRLTCQKQTFPNGPPNSAHVNDGTPNSSNGTFGRFQYFPGLDIFVLINDWNIPAYILRLR